MVLILERDRHHVLLHVSLTVVEALCFAFVAGAMILNIVKFELPSDRNLHFRTFVLAVCSYGGLLLILKHLLNF